MMRAVATGEEEDEKEQTSLGHHVRPRVEALSRILSGVRGAGSRQRGRDRTQIWR